MERSKSKRGRPEGGPTQKPGKKGRQSNLHKADTALGAPAAKRGLKKTPQKKTGDVSDGQRDMRVNVVTGRYRKHSSTLWLDRQLNDPYVAKAKARGYRSRAAFKLTELDDRFRLLSPQARIVDLGCAPGGWCQVAVERGAGQVVGIDYLPTTSVHGAEILELDFLDPAAPDRLKAVLGGPADLVLSDMAAPTTGHKATDHLRVVALAEAALDFAEDVLRPGGAFVCKVFAGGAESGLLNRLRQRFEHVRHAKPKASRPESPEKYVVAQGFRPAPSGLDQGQKRDQEGDR